MSAGKGRWVREEIGGLGRLLEALGLVTSTFLLGIVAWDVGGQCYQCFLCEAWAHEEAE